MGLQVRGQMRISSIGKIAHCWINATKQKFKKTRLDSRIPVQTPHHFTYLWILKFNSFMSRLQSFLTHNCAQWSINHVPSSGMWHRNRVGVTCENNATQNMSHSWSEPTIWPAKNCSTMPARNFENMIALSRERFPSSPVRLIHSFITQT